MQQATAVDVTAERARASACRQAARFTSECCCTAAGQSCDRPLRRPSRPLQGNRARKCGDTPAANDCAGWSGRRPARRNGIAVRMTYP